MAGIGQPKAKTSGTGVVFSSGFFGFFAHAGFLSAIRELGMTPIGYAGASSGAILAAMAASSMSDQVIKETLFNVKKSHFWDPDPLPVILKKVFRRLKGYTGYLRGDGFSKLLEKKRIGISCNPEEWIAEALDMTKLRLISLTPTIAYRSTSLPQPFNTDPADQIIVATAREENATILTKDKTIWEYEHVRSLW